jgi:hypothetical protein
VTNTLRVGLEEAKTWCFASAVDWPGWCRRGKGEDAAVAALLAYADRYQAVAGPRFESGIPRVIGRVKGNATTDFGAPGLPGPWDDEPLDAEEAARQAGLLRASWQAFDSAVASAPAVLPKGPRGGGRDRDAIVGHVREAERTYARKIGVRLPPRTPWDEQRASIDERLRQDDGPEAHAAGWSPRYFLRRTAWHVLDHAWELQDKSDA